MNELIGALFFVLAGQSPISPPPAAVDPRATDPPTAPTQPTAAAAPALNPAAATGANGAAAAAATEGTPEGKDGRAEDGDAPSEAEVAALFGEEEAAEADAFVCFTALMGELRDV
jgi:hypothetical protein